MRVKLNKTTLLLLALAAGAVGARLLAQDAPAAGPRVDIAGDWVVTTHEDQPNYGGGPELGDYTGLPLTAVARQHAESWDASILSQPERQTQTHPVQYVGNNRGPSRITKILDPVTQVHLGYAMAGGFGRADRIIWIDGRPHPSEYSQHTWNGFSTGAWVDGVFVITTTHLKTGHVRRNGVYTTPYARMVEHLFRTGTEMTVFIWIDDPPTLEEPMIRSYTLFLNPNGNTVAPPIFESVEEVDKPLGWVPFWPLGAKQTEYGSNHKIPFEATQGGAETMYPEYQLKLQDMLKRQESAK